MTTDAKKYYFINKRLTGQTLKLFFSEIESKTPEKVLELTNLAAFIDNSLPGQYCLINTVETSTAYGFDISIKLKRPEIKNFKQIVVSFNLDKNSRTFIGLAEDIVFRDFDNEISGDMNY